MKSLKLIAAAAVLALGGAFGGAVGTASAAASCDVGKAGEDLSPRDAYDVYACLANDLYVGYNTGDKGWVPPSYVSDFRNWWPASTLPAQAGVHTNRFLFTYVNETGADTYAKYAEGITMPVGTVIAKESFSVNKKGKAKKGPLFLMEKVAAGKSPKTNDWFYWMVSSKGRPVAVNVFKACNECHSGFEDTDFLGYPVEEVRRKR